MHKQNFILRNSKFLRFLIAGGINTVFGFAVYSICISANMKLWVAVLAGMLLGTVFNFLTTAGYVFRELSVARLPRFIICYLLIYSINMILIEPINLLISNMIFSQAIITFPLAFLSYFLMARFVFFKPQNKSH